VRPFELRKIVRVRDGEFETLFNGASAFETPEFLLEFSPFLRSGDRVILSFRQFSPKTRKWSDRKTERIIP